MNMGVRWADYVTSVELGNKVIKGIEYFVSLWKSVVITEQNNVMVNSEEFPWYHRKPDVIDEVSHKPISL
jgi:hypothetical protein